MKRHRPAQMLFRPARTQLDCQDRVGQGRFCQLKLMRQESNTTCNVVAKVAAVIFYCSAG